VRELLGAEPRGCRAPALMLFSLTTLACCCFGPCALSHAVATDGASTGDTVAGYGTWDVGASDPFSHWFRETETAPDGVAANVSVTENELACPVCKLRREDECQMLIATNVAGHVFPFGPPGHVH
jgi:hypothetical protein